MRAREEIAAVLDEEFIEVLDELGLTERIRTGQLKCGVCDAPVSTGSIRLIYPEGKKIRVVCDKEACLLAFTLGE